MHLWPSNSKRDRNQMFSCWKVSQSYDTWPTSSLRHSLPFCGNWNTTKEHQCCRQTPSCENITNSRSCFKWNRRSSRNYYQKIYHRIVCYILHDFPLQPYHIERYHWHLRKLTANHYCVNFFTDEEIFKKWTWYTSDAFSRIVFIKCMG